MDTTVSSTSDKSPSYMRTESLQPASSTFSADTSTTLSANTSFKNIRQENKPTVSGTISKVTAQWFGGHKPVKSVPGEQYNSQIYSTPMTSTHDKISRDEELQNIITKYEYQLETWREDCELAERQAAQVRKELMATEELMRRMQNTHEHEVTMLEKEKVLMLQECQERMNKMSRAHEEHMAVLSAENQRIQAHINKNGIPLADLSIDSHRTSPTSVEKSVILKKYREKLSELVKVVDINCALEYNPEIISGDETASESVDEEPESIDRRSTVETVIDSEHPEEIGMQPCLDSIPEEDVVEPVDTEIVNTPNAPRDKVKTPPPRNSSRDKLLDQHIPEEYSTTDQSKSSPDNPKLDLDTDGTAWKDSIMNLLLNGF